MSELVEKVARAIEVADDGPFEGPMFDWFARAAIAAVFDWMAEPSQEAIEAGLAEIDTPANYLAFADAMLAHLRREALG